MTRVNSLVNGPPDVSEVHGHRYECSSAPWYRYNQFAQGPGAHHRHEGIFGQNLQQPFPGRFPLTFPAATSTPPCEARAPAETRAQNCARRPTTQRVWGGRGCQYCTNDCLGLVAASRLTHRGRWGASQPRGYKAVGDMHRLQGLSARSAFFARCCCPQRKEE